MARPVPDNRFRAMAHSRRSAGRHLTAGCWATRATVALLAGHGTSTRFHAASGAAIFPHTEAVPRRTGDVASIQQSEDKLLEYLGMVIYEALDWGISDQVERVLSDPLEKLLYFMLKLDDGAMKPAVTLQDVIKACEDHLSRSSEATSQITCRRLFTGYMELKKLITVIQTSKESLRKMDAEGVVEKTLQKKDKHWVFLWPSVVRELQNGVKLRKATERPQHRLPPAELIRSPYELLLDDIQCKRFTLRKVIEQKHRTPKADVAVPKPHLKPVVEGKLKEHMPQESNWHEQLMVKVKQPQSAAARENGSRPKEMIVTPNTALKSPNNSFQTLQDDSTGFKIVDTTSQQLGPEVQENTLNLPSSSWLASARSAVVSSSNAGLAASCTCPPVSAPTLGDIKPNGFLNADQTQLPPYRGRSKSVERGLQSKELDCPFPTKWLTPTIAELIETRYAMMVLQGQGFFQGGSDGVFPRAKICFSCHKQMFLKWPYSCYLCSSVVCCDCCIKMSMPFRTCVHLPLHFLKLLRLSREKDPATQEQKSLELLHEIEHWEYFGVPVTLEPRCLARPLCCYTGPVADWLTADICRRCEQYLLNMSSSQQQIIPPRRTSCP